ncbi:MAG: hypothetical protein IE931_05520 [Sphingobacteriales bacterium]|nr:hypothetical protein [Sphingobacteriales bacterium]
MIVLSGQNLMDVCVQVYGTPAALFDFANANGLAMDADILPGQILNNPASEQAIKVYADYIAESGKLVISGGQPSAIDLLSTNADEVIVNNNDELIAV